MYKLRDWAIPHANSATTRFPLVLTAVLQCYTRRNHRWLLITHWLGGLPFNIFNCTAFSHSETSAYIFLSYVVLYRSWLFIYEAALRLSRKIQDYVCSFTRILHICQYPMCSVDVQTLHHRCISRGIRIHRWACLQSFVTTCRHRASSSRSVLPHLLWTVTHAISRLSYLNVASVDTFPSASLP